MDANLIQQAVMAALESLGISKESMTADPNMPSDTVSEGLPGQGNRLLTWENMDVTVPKAQKPGMWDTSSLFMEKPQVAAQGPLGVALPDDGEPELMMTGSGLV